MSNGLLIIKAFVTYLKMGQFNRLVLIGIIFSLCACQSAQKKQVQQQLVPDERENLLAQQLDRNLVTAYGEWNDKIVEQALNGMVSKLIPADATYQKEAAGTKVHVLATNTPYFAAGLGKIIYISRGALAAIFYENELAFVLATQLALVKEHTAARTLANLQGQEVGESLITLPTAPPALHRDYLAKDWFNPGGLFDYGSEIYIKAEQEGIRLSYSAKYDPRGAVMLIQRWMQPPAEAQMRALGKILPDAAERLNSAREEVAKLSPLRDPIVKTQAFEELQTRLHVKKAKVSGGVKKSATQNPAIKHD